MQFNNDSDDMTFQSKKSFSSNGGNVYTRNSSKVNKQFKIICVGESRVGKTTLIQSYMENMFSGHGTQPTMSWDFKVKQVWLGDNDPNSMQFKPIEQVRLFVWDTAGQERFRQIARMYYNDVQGVLVCFDLTDEESFSNLNFWL